MADKWPESEIPQKEGHAKMRVLFAACCLFGVLSLVSGAAHAGVFEGRPDVVVCSVDDPVNVQRWDQLAFYVSARLEGGDVLYKSLTSNPVLVTISPDGRIAAPNLADCDGKSVEALREAGRAFDF